MEVIETSLKTYLLEAEEIETLEKTLKILENVETDMDKNENSLWHMPRRTLDLISKISYQAGIIDDNILAE